MVEGERGRVRRHRERPAWTEGVPRPTIADPVHSHGESRFVSIGLSGAGRLLPLAADPCVGRTLQLSRSGVTDGLRSC